VGIVILASLTPAITGAPAYADCAQSERNSGDCRSIDAESTNNTVTVRVDTSESGSTGSTGSPGSGTSDPSADSAPGASPPPGRVSGPAPIRMPVLGSPQCEVIMAGMCRGASPPKITPATPDLPSTAPLLATPPTPPRFASELGQFQPERPGLTAQPGEWTMPRLPTNFVAQATTHTQRGELAGWPVEVRFTPVAYHWSFGDGGRARWTQAGKSWSQWGLSQFDPTPTSHVYRQPGAYEARVSVEYRVEFRFVGESFESLSGTVMRDSATTRIRVLTVSPLLLG